MYLFLGVFIFLVCIFAVANHRRRKNVIKKISSLSREQKSCLLNELIEPLGFYYLPSQDLFTLRLDAGQRALGYRPPPLLDGLPVYFNYQDKTWLIEIGKGQYGISTGAKIGVYYADKILDEKEYQAASFASVKDWDMQPFSFQLFRNGVILADVRSRHWLLIALRPGCYSGIKDLCMRASITFPNYEMAQAFAASLQNAGYSSDETYRFYRTVSFPFSKPMNHHCIMKRLYIGYAMWVNRILCKIFIFITHPLCMCLDRMLFLYYYLPFAFFRAMAKTESAFYNKSRHTITNDRRLKKNL